jgi:hypothetical protein
LNGYSVQLLLARGNPWLLRRRLELSLGARRGLASHSVHWLLACRSAALLLLLLLLLLHILE